MGWLIILLLAGLVLLALWRFGRLDRNGVQFAASALPGIAGQSEQQGRGRELDAVPVEPAEAPQREQHQRREQEDDQPAHAQRFRRLKRPRARNKPNRTSRIGAAQSGQVTGSSGGS